jgi:signal transduction histidine kinase
MSQRVRLLLGGASALAFAAGWVGCLGTRRGDAPAIVMTRIPPAAVGGPFQLDIIEGRVVGAKPGQQIVLFARSGSWWVQPMAANPFTSIDSGSRWTNSTHLGTEYAAFLVEPGYRPPARTDSLPPVGDGLIAVAVVMGDRFWNAAWFRLVLVTLSGLAMLGLYGARMRRRTRELEVRFEERLAERTRLAQELHDTLLQGFVSASFQLHVALSRMPDDSPVKASLDRVVQVMGQVVEEGRHTVRGLRSPVQDPEDLERSLGTIGEEVSTDTEHPFRVTVTPNGTPRVIRPLLRDEVYRIGREAILNARRQGGATTVEIELAYQDDGLRLVVRDNGRGVDPEAGDGDAHRGLRVMSARAKAIGGQLDVRSISGKGTEVVLWVPARLGFEGEAPRRRGFLGAWLGRRRAGRSDRERRGPIP